jgi:ATP-binding cassette, subfamily C (CFTR/MRP), member 4
VWIGKRAAHCRLKTAVRTDKRVRLMNEVIQAIQVIKMYAWERPFAKIIHDVRKQEVNGIRGTLFTRATVLCFNLISHFSIFLSLVLYIFFNNYFTARQVFIVTSYFNLLYGSMLHYWPIGLTYIAESYISVRRIEKFLLFNETKAQLVQNVTNLMSNGSAKTEKGHANGKLHTEDMQRLLAIKMDKSVHRIVKLDAPVKGIQFSNASASWIINDNEYVTGISSINLEVKTHSLCAIVGTVGSGKTSLLEAVLGELELDQGTVEINGSISYASQDPWLFEGTIRKNIVFIEPFNAARYKEVVKVCALQRDFELLPHGDRTIVGERGVSLSGGQRARINLARAIYKQSDIYLLDDPLSAVDTHVGKYIFEQCITGFLRNKACILVTHQLQYLKDVEHIVLMNFGSIESQGPFRDVANSRQFFQLSQTVAEEDEKQTNTLESTGRDETVRFFCSNFLVPIMICCSFHQQLSCQADDDSLEDGKASAEEQAVGSIGFRMYKSYFTSLQNYWFAIIVFVFFILAEAGITGMDFFVAKW